MHGCETCAVSFWYQDDCENHMDSYGHWPECETCNRTFRKQRFCIQHMNDTGHWASRFECETCNKVFDSQDAADQHMTDIGHWTPKVCCETCQRKFYDQKATNQHMNALGHWAPKLPCETCCEMFHTPADAEQHMKDQNHYKNYCRDCVRRFQNENSLKMHLNSKTHRGAKIPCPFCKAKYTTASGVTHHVESGSCPSAPKLNRETISSTIRERDREGIITNKHIEWRKEDDVQYSATDHAFNGSFWECYLCHRAFKKRNSLNQHLNSPVHRQDVYRCPNVKRLCGKQFTELAGLFNHLESESCGFMRFERLQQQADDVLRGRGLIAFMWIYLISLLFTATYVSWLYTPAHPSSYLLSLSSYLSHHDHSQLRPLCRLPSGERQSLFSM